jgi:hypothetical protein
MKLDNEEGYKKAGDLYFSAGDYSNAFTAYDKGGVAEGIKKYADKLYEEGDASSADAQYVKAAEVFATKQNNTALVDMAKTAEERGKYTMAADFYTKGGEPNKATKARAYGNLTTFDFEGAKTEFTTFGDAEMVKAIDANMKYLTPLKDAATFLDDTKLAAPRIDPTDATTAEQNTMYYKDNLSSIVDNVYIVSTNVSKITNPALKDALMRKFKQYGAVRNVLDPNTFAKKLKKEQVTEKDAAL